MKKKNKQKKGKRKYIVLATTLVMVLASVGMVGALNGWFGGGGSVPQDTTTLKLMGYWNFDEGSGSTAYDSSGQGRHGTLWFCGDTLTDSDSQTYNTVLVGSQCWMAENLNVTTTDAAKGDLSAYGYKYCYNDNESNCDTYGGLYQWDTAMAGESSSNSEPSGVQGICPSGWHIPSDAEWHTLEDYLDESTCDGDRVNAWDCDPAGAKMAGNASLWTDGVLDSHGDFGASGLDILPAGYRSTDGSYYGLSYRADLWSSFQYDASNAWRRDLNYTHTDVIRNYTNKAYGFSVRCVRD